MVAADLRLVNGLRRQLEARAPLLAAGARRLGWKAGFGAAPVQAMLGTTGPLVGFLTDATLLGDGATQPIGDWTAPLLEAEIAVRMGAAVAGGGDMASTAAAIDALAPAIELADIDGALDDVEAMLAGNLFHRRVLLGKFDTARAGADVSGIVLDVTGREQVYARDADPTAIVGDLVAVVHHIAASLATVGERLLAGDVVITGAAVPPLAVAPGERVTVAFRGLGEVAVEVTT